MKEDKIKNQRKHNIELFGNLTDHNVTIKGNGLDCRWFDKCILVWSDKDNKNPLPKAILEAIEDSINKELRKNGKL